MLKLVPFHAQGEVQSSQRGYHWILIHTQLCVTVLNEFDRTFRYLNKLHSANFFILFYSCVIYFCLDLDTST